MDYSILERYEKFVPTTAIYPRECSREYLMTGIASEVGELCGVTKKYLRDKTSYGEYCDQVLAESGDVLWYLTNILSEVGYDLESAMKHNMSKLSDRMSRDKIKGSGDNR